MPLPLFALFLAAFAVGTTELIISGILPSLAADLSVDIPTAGLLISGYAIAVAIGGPILSLATTGLPRRRLLLVLMVVFVAGNVLCALSTSYWLLMGARLVIACSHGLFFGVAMIIAGQLVPKERQGSAISFVIAGITIASVLGVPIGTAIGNAYGWRATFWAISAVGVAATVALAALIPITKVHERQHRANLSAEIQAVSHQAVFLSYAVIALYMTAILAVLAYVVPMLTTVTGFSTSAVPWLLFAGASAASSATFWEDGSATGKSCQR
jgi:DHA1 family inner membrane transport protein